MDKKREQLRQDRSIMIKDEIINKAEWVKNCILSSIHGMYFSIYSFHFYFTSIVLKALYSI